jgi:hypothetical protein
MAPASAEKRKARIGTVMCEDARAELRIVISADCMRSRAAHKIHLLFIWLLYTRE